MATKKTAKKAPKSTKTGTPPEANIDSTVETTTPDATTAPEATTAEPKVEPPKSVVAGICSELKVDPRAARRKLRAAGMKAPYLDGEAVRKVLTATVEEEAK